MSYLRETIGRLVEGHHAFAVWNFYFLLELYLFHTGAIRLDIVLNILLMLFVLARAPQALARYRAFRYGRSGVNLLLAVLLLWHQSWLPTPSQVAGLLDQYGLPSSDYMFSFTSGIFTMSALIMLFALATASYVLRKQRLVMLTVLPALFMTAPLISAVLGESDEAYPLVGIQTAQAAQTVDPAGYLEAFYESEAERTIQFKAPAATEAPFDIVVLHVCSLSWDDLKEIDIGPDAPFFKQFDYLFTNFNTATGYSGPAVLRLLQASCGQRTHREIHGKDTPAACQMFTSLATVGYETFVGMSHDGVYGDFIGSVKENTPANTVLLSPGKLQPQAIFFDGKTPLFNDHDVLERWLDARQSSSAERAALYYNSVLLHAGVRWKGEKTSRGRDAHTQFTDVSGVLLEDVQAFIDTLKKSKRNTVLLFVPEHGRALVGSPLQPADMRDIPLPKITKVPVGVKLIGPQFNKSEAKQAIVSKPTSYLALAWLLSQYVSHSPFGDGAQSADNLAFRMPRTEFVAEHEGRVVMELEGKYMYRSADGKWEALTARQLQ